jgi:GNAT superfamily N-acetyltransferase
MAEASFRGQARGAIMSTKTRKQRTYSWEILHAADPLLPAVRELYESALPSDERVPWEWLERGVKTRGEWRPGGWGKHLIVASPQRETTDPERLAGFAFAAHVPGYGGYLSYIAVADQFRGRGVGARLFEQAFNLLAVDAAAVDETLPFVIWESRRPDAAAAVSSREMWNARLRLFHKAGGFWVDGVTLPSPNWTDPAAPAVPLQLFLAPVDEPREAFDSPRVREAVAGLLTNVYRAGPGDAEYDCSLPPGCLPRLKPAADAGRTAEVSR